MSSRAVDRDVADPEGNRVQLWEPNAAALAWDPGPSWVPQCERSRRARALVPLAGRV
jgi:hypothetical protein